MYKVNDYVVYKKNVCKVKAIKNNKLNGIDYYILVPIDDDSLIIDVPVDNRMGYLRDVISKKETEELINSIPSIEPLDNIDEKYIERTYKNLIGSGDYKDLIKIIKTSYLRNEMRSKNNRRPSEKDRNYFNQAEKYLYNELSISLNMSFDETKNYIVTKVQKLMK